MTPAPRHTQPLAVVFIRDAADYCLAVMHDFPVWQWWRAYRCVYVARLMARTRVILERCK